MKRFTIILVFALLIPRSDNIEQLFLPNGLKLILKEDNTRPSIGIAIFYNVGSHDDPEDQKGMSALQSYIIEQSSPIGMSYNDVQDRIFVQDRILQITHNNRWKHTEDYLYFSYELHPAHLPEIIAFEANRLSMLEIDGELLKRAQDRMIDKGKHRYSSPAKLYTTYPEGHPYKTTTWGDSTHVRQVTVESAIDFRNRYINPNSTTIVIVGSFDSTDITKLIFSNYGNIVNRGKVQNDPDLSVSDVESVPHLTEKVDAVPMYGQLAFVETTIPSFRNDEMLTFLHIQNLINYDLETDGYYSRYLNKLGLGKVVSIHRRIGPSKFQLMNYNMFKRVSNRKMKKTFSKMVDKLSIRGFDEDIINAYRKKELLRTYKEERNFRPVAVRIGQSELIYGDFRKYNSVIESLEMLDNDQIKRVTQTYLAGQPSSTFEAHFGKWKPYVPILSFMVNGIVRRIPVFRKSFNIGFVSGFRGAAD